MRPWRCALRPTRHCRPRSANGYGRIAARFRCSTRTVSGGILKLPTPPCGRSGSAARPREVSASSRIETALRPGVADRTDCEYHLSLATGPVGKADVVDAEIIL